MERLFYPKSVVVIGVSEDPNNLARTIVDNLIEFQFGGELFLVGKKEGTFSERRIYTSLEHLPQGIDVAVILTPAHTVPALIESCGRKEIRWVIIETGGFKEYSQEGSQLEKEILRIARKWGIRIVGPNGVGILNFENGFVAPFVQVKQEAVRKGKVSILAQSGGVLFTYVNLLFSANVGIAKMVSMGNKIDLDETDYLKYLIKDPETDIIGLYAEGLDKGRELMDIARSTSKPIILHKANTGEGSRHIAKLHTAALANDDKIVDAAMKQAHIVRARNFRSFANATKIFSLPPMKGNNLVILARSGGIAIIAADFAEQYRFRLFPFTQRFQNRIHSYFRAKVIQPTNPLDLGDLFDFDLYVKILEQVLKVRRVNGVLFHHGTTGVDTEPSRRLIRTIKDLSFRYQKPVALCYLADEEEQAFVKRSIDYPIFNEPEDGLGALAVSRDYYCRHPVARRISPKVSVKRSQVRQILQEAREGKRDLLLTEALDVIQAYGIPVAKGTLVHSTSDVRRVMKKVGTPVALKIVSPQISHKSDVGGVRLNVDQPSEAEQAYRKMKNLSRGNFHGMLIQRMIPNGKEVILGVKRDPSFGPVLLFGLGGIYAEILEEVSLRVAPIHRHEAEEMILESKAGKILKGLRGEGALDSDAVVESLLRLSQLITDFPEIEGIDINPLKVLKKGAVALDARILLTRTEEK